MWQRVNEMWDFPMNFLNVWGHTKCKKIKLCRRVCSAFVLETFVCKKTTQEGKSLQDTNLNFWFNYHPVWPCWKSTVYGWFKYSMHFQDSFSIVLPSVVHRESDRTSWVRMQKEKRRKRIWRPEVGVNVQLVWNQQFEKWLDRIF